MVRVAIIIFMTDVVRAPGGLSRCLQLLVLLWGLLLRLLPTAWLLLQLLRLSPTAAVPWYPDGGFVIYR